MTLDTVYSINGVPIRLSEERWDHIVDKRPYMLRYYDAMLDAIQQPKYILRGERGTLVAVQPLARSNYLQVVYRELGTKDGFVITAMVTQKINKKRIVWREGN